MKQNIGVIGLSVMGSNLALNIADNGFKVAVFNRTTTVVDKMLEEHPHKNVVGRYSLQELIDGLEKPRKVVLMVKAGFAVDSLIEQLTPLLEKGDIIIDGGKLILQRYSKKIRFIIRERNQLLRCWCIRRRRRCKIRSCFNAWWR